jgi:uncharacterized membrane protein (UPF0127 family)
LVAASVMVSCSDDDAAVVGSAPDTSNAIDTVAPDTTQATLGDTTRVPDTSGTTVTRPVPGRTPLPGFGEVAVRITDAAGVVLQWCMLLADTANLRAQGLMEVTDPTLGGYDGMIFRFGEPTTSSFYMLKTRLPLSIAFYDGATFVSAADMEPCPNDDDDPRCPRYSADGPYTEAIEVPQGNLERLGIGPGTRLEVGGDCPAPTTG